MNTCSFKKTGAARFWASVMTAAMACGAFVAPFSVQAAANITGVSSLQPSYPAGTEIALKVVRGATLPVNGTVQVALASANGGVFGSATLASGCNDDGSFSATSANITGNTGQKAFCYKNSTVGEDTITATFTHGNAVEVATIKILITAAEGDGGGDEEGPVVDNPPPVNSGQCPAEYTKLMETYSGGISWVADANYASVILVGGPDNANNNDPDGRNKTFANVSSGTEIKREVHDISHICAILASEVASIEPLTLTSMCTYADGGAKWRVRNDKNPITVDFTWEIVDDQETGGPLSATAGPAGGAGDTFFDSTLTGTMKVYWYDENGTQKSTTKATNPALCAESVPVCVDATSGAWAATVVTSEQKFLKNGGPITDVHRTDPAKALGPADWTAGGSTGFFSLGFGGSIALSFDQYVVDVPGNDIAIHEVTNGSYPLESAAVEISQNGTTWVPVGVADNTGVGRITNLDIAGTGLAWFKYIRLTDTTNPALHGGTADGFDLDAVKVTKAVCDKPHEEDEEVDPLLATVTMCKLSSTDEALSGWTLMLLGDKVDEFTVPADVMAGTNSTALTGGISYVAIAEGTWTNNRTLLNIVDAEYSTEDNWVTVVDGFPGYQTDILELQINSTFDPDSNWGTFNSAHRYAQSFIPAVDGPANFRIFDGTGTTPQSEWYNDNSGSLAVTVYEGFAGVTGENGCVTFSDVPHGTYTSAEIMLDGWENVSGLGAVVVDESQHTFTVVNRAFSSAGDTGGSNNEPAYYTLTVAIAGDGTGTVTDGEQGGIVCATDGGEENDCSESYLAGTVVSLSALPGENSNFDNSWTIGAGTCADNTTPCEITMDQNHSVVANFDLNDIPVAVTSFTGGSSATRTGRRVPGQVAGASDSTNGASGNLGAAAPAGLVLGEQVSVVPYGAAGTGAGGGSIVIVIPAVPSAVLPRRRTVFGLL